MPANLHPCIPASRVPSYNASIAMNVLALIGLSLVNVAPGDFDIVPGGRIGHVKLGLDVPASLGQPTFSDGAAGHVWSTWVGSTGNTLDIFAVIGNTAGHEVKFVRVTSHAFHTASGVKTGQTWGQIQNHYSGIRIKTYDSHQFHRKLAIMDNKTKGVSFEVTVNAANHVTNGSKCVAIWVHKKGVAFDPSTWVIYEPMRP